MKSLKRLIKRSWRGLLFLAAMCLIVYSIIYWFIVFVSSIIADSIHSIFS